MLTALAIALQLAVAAPSAPEARSAHRVVWKAPDYSLTRISCDGICLPRGLQHVLIAGAAQGIASGLRLTGVPPRVADVSGWLGRGLLPHAIATLDPASDVWPLNPRDWVFELTVTALPLITGQYAVSMRRGIIASLAYAAVYSAAYPWGSP